MTTLTSQKFYLFKILLLHTFVRINTHTPHNFLLSSWSSSHYCLLPPVLCLGSFVGDSTFILYCQVPPHQEPITQIMIQLQYHFISFMIIEIYSKNGTFVEILMQPSKHHSPHFYIYYIPWFVNQHPQHFDKFSLIHDSMRIILLCYYLPSLLV